MPSQVELHSKLKPTITVCDGLYEALQADPPKLCRDAHALVIDNIAWDCNITALHAGLSQQQRRFKEPFTDGEPASEIKAELTRLVEHVQRLYRFLYPSYPAGDFSWYFRNMVSGNEPMHFDFYEASESPKLAAFLNIATTPRKYRIGPSLYELVETDRNRMLALWREGGNFAKQIRNLTEKDSGPLNRRTPCHKLDLAPESIWFLNPRTVSHELVYGEGAVSAHWLVPNLAEPPSRIMARAAMAT